MPDAFRAPDPPLADEGLGCLECDYNLTGLTGSVCPECGTAIDWEEVKACRDATLHQEVPLNATYWDTWPVHLKPVGFVATALEAALLPWRFAAKMPACPRLDMALAFAGICLIWLIAGTGFGPADLVPDGTIWAGAVCLHIPFQTVLLSVAFRPPDLRQPGRFWLAVSCYTTWPVLFEAFSGSPPLILDQSNLWPFVLLLGGEPSLLLSVLYIGWWLGLGVIVVTRMRARFVLPSALVLLVSIPAITVLTSYIAIALGGMMYTSLP